MLPPLFLSVRVPTKLAIFWRAHLAPAARDDSPRRDTLTLLVIRLDGLGDVVLTTPLFRELKRAFPGSCCTVVVQEAFRQLLVTNPHIDEIISLRPLRTVWLPARVRTLLSVLRLYWGRLRGRRFDLAISPRWDVDDQLATFLASLVDAKQRVGYTELASPAKQRHNRGFDTAFSACLAAGPVQHEVLRNLEIVSALGGKVEDSKLDISLTQHDREFASKLLANVPASSTLVAVGIGGRSASRRWPLENYAQSLAQLWKEHRMQPVIICSDGEWEEACKLDKLLCCEAIIISGAPLRKVCAVLERCDLFIGNDSGSAHLAGAMNCKTIVISRHPSGGDPNHANSPIRFAPYCDRVRVLQPEAGLEACRAECLSSEPHCIKAVSVEQAVAAVRELLRSDQSLPSCIQAKVSPPHSDHSRPAIDPAAAVALSRAAELSKVARNRTADLP
jgi:ADP-heptose:LPS heptosyltransferase